MLEHFGTKYEIESSILKVKARDVTLHAVNPSVIYGGLFKIQGRDFKETLRQQYRYEAVPGSNIQNGVDAAWQEPHQVSNSLFLPGAIPIHHFLALFAKRG